MKKKLLVSVSFRLTGSETIEHLNQDYDLVFKIIKEYLKKKSDNS
tara:strand:+ start:153 stop:287 length:135 start_codon:yes stop_codon:yes gene_type:complete